MIVENWPMWSNGEPVRVGEIAMSDCGPMRIDGIEVTASGWRLWSNQSMYEGADKWLYVIDEGDRDGYPTKYSEPCDFWEPGDDVMPAWVFAPIDLDEGKRKPSIREAALEKLVSDMRREMNYESVRAEDGSNGCLDRMAEFDKRMEALGITEAN